MGKKRVIKKAGSSVDQGLKSRALLKAIKRTVAEGLLSVEATFNNTKAVISDKKGNVIVSSSAGSLGFSGAKKGTPFAAAKVGELLGDKALMMGMKDAEVIIRGVGPGRESLLRAFAGKGIGISKITDDTPLPFNGPRPRKPRRI